MTELFCWRWGVGRTGYAVVHWCTVSLKSVAGGSCLEGAFRKPAYVSRGDVNNALPAVCVCKGERVPWKTFGEAKGGGGGLVGWAHMSSAWTKGVSKIVDVEVCLG